MRRLIALGMVFFFLFGCSSSTLVESNLVQILFRWTAKGKTLSYSDRAVGRTYQVACGEGIFTRAEFWRVKVVK
jgi:hypothetical protein